MVRVRDVKAMGRSEPSSMMCDKTAPIPTGEASQASLNGRPGSYWVSTISDVISFFTVEGLLALCGPLPSFSLLQEFIKGIECGRKVWQELVVVVVYQA